MKVFAQTDHLGFSKIPITTTYNTSDYHGGIQNWGISQNSKGFIYIANNFGLLEFDGQNWRKYEVLNNTRVRSLFIDADSRIYIGGQNQFGYFNPDTLGGLSFHSLYDKLPDSKKNLEDIWSIIPFNESILFCSYDGIFSYQDDTLTQLKTPGENERVFKVSEKLFTTSFDYGMSLWEENGFKIIPGSEIFSGKNVTAILPHHNNSHLIFCEDGSIFKWENGEFEAWNTVASDFLSRSGINTALLLNNNDIAIGTQNNGVLTLSPSGAVKLHLTKHKGLSHRTVLSLYQDQFQNLWVGLNNGLSMIELSSPFSLINEQSGLPGTGYCALLHEDKLYLGTSNGLFYQDKNPNPIGDGKYKMVDNTSGQVYNIQQIGNQLLLGHHNGAYVVKGDEAQNIYSNAGVWKFETIPQREKILAGTYEGLIVSELSPNQPPRFEKVSQFDESSRVFHMTNDSSLFMTHGYKGVFKLTMDYQQNEITEQEFYGENSGFPANRLINAFQIGDELLFPALTGVYEYNPTTNSFDHNEEFEKYFDPNIHVSELEYSYDGTLYFLSDNEVGYLKKNNYEDFEKNTSKFVRIRKYLSDDLENITALDHENVLFGAKEGFIHYNPIKPQTRDQELKVYIRKVESKADGHGMDYYGADNSENLENNHYTYPANFKSLKFTYAAPYFNGQDEISYQYQLDNFENEWSDFSTVNEKEYTNLSQGNYTFKVRAMNVFGEISQPATFAFSVFPPWYKSKFAYALYAFILVLLFGIAMYIQSAKHKQDKAELTINQQKELERKDSALEEVSKQSKLEISKLRNDKLRLEIDHKNRELATTTMHLINKNEFMLSIRDTIKELAKTGSKEGIKKLVKDIDRNMAEEEGWEEFTKHFDQVHGGFLTNIKKDHPTLTPQEIKLCAYLRMNMSSKEIANLLNISVRGVEIGRYRLRKKLEISRETNLVDYMLEY